MQNHGQQSWTAGTPKRWHCCGGSFARLCICDPLQGVPADASTQAGRHLERSCCSTWMKSEAEIMPTTVPVSPSHSGADGTPCSCNAWKACAQQLKEVGQTGNWRCLRAGRMLVVRTSLDGAPWTCTVAQRAEILMRPLDTGECHPDVWHCAAT